MYSRKENDALPVYILSLQMCMRVQRHFPSPSAVNNHPSDTKRTGHPAGSEALNFEIFSKYGDPHLGNPPTVDRLGRCRHGRKSC